MEAVALSPPAAANAALIQKLRTDLWVRADASRAVRMQAYMRSVMPFLGVPIQSVRALCRSALAEFRLEGLAEWRSTILALWREATYREELYAALEILQLPHFRPFRTIELLPLYEELVIAGGWWDTADTIAASLLGELVVLDPAAMTGEMRRWARDANLWKRRSAILCQLNLGTATDQQLLYDCIEPSLSERSILLRKAIGWAVREYARIAPEAVIRYVEEHSDRLSPRSKREALRQLRRSGPTSTVDA